MPGQLHADTARILRDGKLQIGDPWGIRITLIEQVVDACGHIEMAAEITTQYREIKHRERRDRTAIQRLNTCPILRIEADEQLSIEQWLAEIQLAEVARGVAEQQVRQIIFRLLKAVACAA